MLPLRLMNVTTRFWDFGMYSIKHARYKHGLREPERNILQYMSTVSCAYMNLIVNMSRPEDVTI